MQDSKPGSSLIVDFLLRLLGASAFLLIIVFALFTFRSGITAPGHLPIGDVYLVTGLLVAFCLPPAVLGFWSSALKPAVSRLVSYAFFALLQTALTYAYLSWVSQVPGNELHASPLVFLKWITLPTLMLFYPVFYAARGNSIARLAVITLGVLLIFASLVTA